MRVIDFAFRLRFEQEDDTWNELPPDLTKTMNFWEEINPRILATIINSTLPLVNNPIFDQLKENCTQHNIK